MTHKTDPEARTPEQKLALFDDLRQAERRAVSSRVASVIAHLIGTPLHVIAGRASLIRATPGDPSVEENARRIEDQVERLARRIRGLIDYLTAPEATTSEEHVASVVAEALALYVPVAGVRGVELELVGTTPAGATLDGTSALVVLTSLLSLATRIAPRDAKCQLAVSAVDERQLSFELTVPGLELPTGRFDTLEPPEQLENSRIEELQVLAVCSAIARRNSGGIEVVKAREGAATIRYTVARLA
jgi:signal transduction histidine kinase